jgi:3-hydroxyisobutyrate dehydrogenase-like beta-hydroxyacid dehydrogenase
MGSAMSGNLLAAGFQVAGHDISQAAVDRFTQAGGQACADIAELTRRADVLIFSLPSATALHQASEAVARTGRAGLVIVETSTLDIDDKAQARDILQAAGITLLDCPLSGTGAQALVKDVSIYSSGPADVVDQLADVFAGFAKANYYLGDFGNGMRMKLMANLLVAIHNVSTAEVLVFGEKMGIPSALACKVLADGAGGSRMFSVRGPMMAHRGWEHATMKVSIWQKDMKLINAALTSSNTQAPLFAATLPIYSAAMALGHAEHDTAAVFDVLNRM